MRTWAMNAANWGDLTSREPRFQISKDPPFGKPANRLSHFAPLASRVCPAYSQYARYTCQNSVAGAAGATGREFRRSSSCEPASTAFAHSECYTCLHSSEYSLPLTQRTPIRVSKMHCQGPNARIWPFLQQS